MHIFRTDSLHIKFSQSERIQFPQVKSPSTTSVRNYAVVIYPKPLYRSRKYAVYPCKTHEVFQFCRYVCAHTVQQADRLDFDICPLRIAIPFFCL